MHRRTGRRTGRRRWFSTGSLRRRFATSAGDFNSSAAEAAFATECAASLACRRSASTAWPQEGQSNCTASFDMPGCGAGGYAGKGLFFFDFMQGFLHGLGTPLPPPHARRNRLAWLPFLDPPPPHARARCVSMKINEKHKSPYEDVSKSMKIIEKHKFPYENV